MRSDFSLPSSSRQGYMKLWNRLGRMRWNHATMQANSLHTQAQNCWICSVQKNKGNTLKWNFLSCLSNDRFLSRFVLQNSRSLVSFKAMCVKWWVRLEEWQRCVFEGQKSASFLDLPCLEDGKWLGSHTFCAVRREFISQLFWWIFLISLCSHGLKQIPDLSAYSPGQELQLSSCMTQARASHLL